MEHHKKERRFLNVELRATRADEGSGNAGTISGYAAKFGVVSEDLGGFREVLLPGCFDVSASPDVVCNYEHDDCRMLGRTSSGTLKLSTDDTGLAFECSAPDTTLGRDVCELIRRGDLRSNSFAFEVAEDGEEWATADDGLPLRKISRCILYDVSVVIHPAYPETELAIRSLEKSKAAPPRLDLYRARLKLASLEA